MPTRKPIELKVPRKTAQKLPATLKEEAPFPRPQSAQEALPDGTLLCHFVIPNRPATKKTHQRIVRRGGFNRILPSKQYEEYEAQSAQYCLDAWKCKGEVPMDFGVNILLRAYMPNWAGMPDQCGILQSLGDIIEKHGVISNDKFIQWMSSNEHWFSIDKDNPRVELWIYRQRHPYEGYRADQEESETRKRERAQARAEKKSGVTL